MGKVDPKMIGVISRFKRDVSNKYNIEKMILFGSRATGMANKDSDVDLLVVVKRPVKKLVSRLLLDWHVTHKIEYPVDFIGFTKEEFDEQSKKITIVKQALDEGLVIT